MNLPQFEDKQSARWSLYGIQSSNTCTSYQIIYLLATTDCFSVFGSFCLNKFFYRVGPPDDPNTEKQSVVANK